MNIINIFTDSATSPPTGIAVGGFLSLSTEEIGAYANASQTILLQQLMQRINYIEYETKKSTWAEIKTVIHALHSLENTPNRIVNLYTDCKSLCDLIESRQEKLEKNNFLTRSGKTLNNTDLYIELFAIAKKFQIKPIKIKGHAAQIRRYTAQEKIFSIVDRLCRKQLRSILKNHLNPPAKKI